MARGAYFLTMKNTFLLFCTLALILSSCNNNGQIKCVTEISTPISENVSSTMNITLANPDDICPISMPPDNKKEYTPKGLLAKEIFYTSDGTVSGAVTYEYTNGKETKQTKYSGTGSEENSIVTEYSDGKISKSTCYTAFGTINYTDIFTYEKNKSTQQSIDENGNPFCIVQSTYDNNGNKIIEEIELAGVPVRITYTYDSNNLLIEQTESDNTKWLFKYDKNKNIIEKKCCYSDGSTSSETYTLKYDNRNNWIEKTCYLDGKPIFKTKRTIEYFE